MRAIILAHKDLLQRLRDWKTAIFLVALPIVFTLFFGIIFGGSGGEDDARLPISVLNQDDGGMLGRGLTALLEGTDAMRLVPEEGRTFDELSNSVADGDLVAALIVPAGYTETILAGRLVPLDVIVDAETPAGQSVSPLLQMAAMRLLGAVKAAQLSAGAYADTSGFASEEERQSYIEEAISKAIEAWQEPPLAVSVEMAVPEKPEAETGSAAWFGENPFAHSSPGMMIQFAIVGLIGSAEILVAERKTRALQRLLTTSIIRTEILIGHLLAMFLIVFVQMMILIVFGQLVLGLNYFHTPAATILLAAMMALWSATLGLLIGVLAKSAEQATLFALIPMFVFSALGGAWMPLEFTSPAFSAVGHLTPTAWAIDGFKGIIIRGEGMNAVLLPLAILLAWSIAFLAMAIWRFEPE